MKATPLSNRLRVGFTIGPMSGGGIARYSFELASALVQRPEIALVPIGTREAIGTFIEAFGRDAVANGKIVITRSSQLGEAMFIWKALGRRAQEARLDLLHGTKHLLPRSVRMPTVLTIHDLTAIERRHEFPIKKRLLLPALYERSIRNADCLVAVSRAVADHVSTVFPDRTACVLAVPHAVPRSFLLSETETVPNLEGHRFALTVGDMSPRKNLELLLEIWPRVHESTGLVLVVAGNDGWKSERVVLDLGKLQEKNMAVKLGRVSDEQLRWLYEAASVCCVPSLEEGFGFPVIEAIARGCPVVASTDSALVEAGQGHATHVPADDRSGWIDAIGKVVASGRRERIVLARNWHDVADELAACYVRTVAQHGGRVTRQ